MSDQYSKFYMEAPQQNILKHIGHYAYNLSNLLGKGYSSSVYKGFSTLTHEELAIKVIVLASVRGDVPRGLLANQLRALKQLSHPNTIRTHDICQTANNMYIVSEFCNQGDLLSVLRKGLSEEQCLEIFLMIAEGLNYISEQGIVHRDIKPANVLMRDGVAKLCDFGFCGFLQDQQRPFLAESFSVGSPLYMSPEAYRRNCYSIKSDIWAAGITLYEMLIGEQPFKGLSYDMLVRAAMEVPRSVRADDFTRSMLSKMLCVEPDARISPLELMWELRNYKACRIQRFQLKPLLTVPVTTTALGGTQQRIGSAQIISSNTVIRGNSLTSAHPNIFANCAPRQNNALVPPAPKGERATSIQRAIEQSTQPNTNRTALGELSNRIQNLPAERRSPPKLKRTSSSKAVSINQINIMHRHLIGVQPTTGGQHPALRQGLNSAGTLTKKSCASYSKPVREHVVHSWVQLCRLLRKLLTVLERFLPAPTELVCFEEPEATEACQIFLAVYNQLTAATQQLTKLAKGVTNSPSRSTSTNESSSVDNPLLELEAAGSSLSSHKRLQLHLCTSSEQPTLPKSPLSESAISKLKPSVATFIRELERTLYLQEHQLAYLYLVKYYETLEVVKGRRSEDMVSVAGMGHLLSGVPAITQDLIQSAKTLAAVLIR